MYVGCASWQLPKGSRERFPEEGTHLERYAQVFPAVEINSSHYNHHKPATYEKWARSVPGGFRFSVKMHRAFTHEGLLEETDGLDEFLEGPLRLGDRLGALLVQLPPSLPFHRPTADRFTDAVRALCRASLVWEPRHESWFREDARQWLADRGVARCGVDPVRPVEAAAEPEPNGTVWYLRLHGSPNTYYSAYRDQEGRLPSVAERLLRAPRPAWCIFDNTAAGEAVPDALELLERAGSAGEDA